MPVWAKRLMRPHLNGKKLEVWYATVIPATAGSIKQEDHNTSQPGQKVRPYLKKIIIITRAKRAGSVAQVV
jgi:hypothetical protein